MPNIDKEKNEKLLQLAKLAVQKDLELRQKHNVGEKFRFIRDRLKGLLEQVEESIQLTLAKEEHKTDALAEDEVLVYVYLFNAQGLVLQTWQKMVHPSVLYEYSVNRPIYTEKSAVEAAIRAKANKVQHAFLTVALKKSNITPLPAGSEVHKDLIGGELIKIKEGSLNINRLIAFTHNGQEYVLNQKGELIKKA